nr:hypothetical protein [Planctomycetota bacterium]
MYKYVLVFITALVPLQLSAAQQPTAAELLEKYTQNREKLKSFTLKYEEEVHGDGRKFLANYRTLGKRNIYKGGYFGKIRSDGDRHYQSEKFWDENMPLRAHSKSEAEASPIYTSHLWDGKKHYQYMFSSKGAEKDWLIIDDGREPSKINFTISDIVIRTSRDHILRGGFHNSQQRGPLKLIDEELKEVDSIFVQKDTEEINGSQCYVIKAKSKDSEYKIWIDPEHGYNIAKARIFRGGEGVEYGNENEISLLTYLRDVRFEKIEGIWVPMEADYGLHIKRAKGSYLKTNHHIKRTEFVLNPDHDALGSFDIDYVRNGARTVILGVKGIKYRWQDGELIPNIDKLVIAELDRMAAEVAAEREGSDVNNLAVAEISIPDGNDVFIPDANA